MSDREEVAGPSSEPRVDVGDLGEWYLGFTGVTAAPCWGWTPGSPGVSAAVRVNTWRGREEMSKINILTSPDAAKERWTKGLSAGRWWDVVRKKCVVAV